MQDAIISRCGNTKYCIRLWCLLNPDKNLDEFVSELALAEVTRQLAAMKDVYKSTLSDKSVSSLLNSSETWQHVHNLVTEKINALDDDKLLDLVLNTSLEGAPNI